MRKVLAAAALVVGGAGSAVAAGVTTPLPVYAPPPPVAPVSDGWVGPYVGAVAGYGWGTITAPPGPTTEPVAGPLVGLFVGYNAQRGSIVYGGEADMAWSGAAGIPGVSVNWIASFRARAGYALGKVLLYATAGTALGGVNSAANPISEVTQAWLGVFGAGAEIALPNGMIGRVEYLRYRMEGGGGEQLSFGQVRGGVGLAF